MSGVVQKDVVAGWQQVTQMSMKARLGNKSSAQDNVPDSTFDSLSNLPMVGYNVANTSTETAGSKSSSDVIVLSDEELDGPMKRIRENGSSASSPQKAVTSSSPIQTDTLSIREKLLEEERKLNVLKALKNCQNPELNSTSNGNVKSFSKTHSIATLPPPIQGSALNKSTAKSSGIRMATYEHHGISQRVTQPRRNIVVVPGTPKTSNSVTVPVTTSVATGISSRLQQLVHNVAVNQALPSGKDLSRLASSVQGHTSHRSSPGPPIPSLITSKSTVSVISHSTGQTIKPNIPIASKPRHEVSTIHPPPLLHSTTPSSLGSVIVPANSSSTAARNLAILALNKEELTDKDKLYIMQVVENSKRYRDYMLKQTHTRRSFTKVLERKIVVAPYPKTFRQVWPIIPVHDSSFVANFGLEGVVNHFQSNHKDPVEKSSSVSKVKPICNQCNCDFASAWQIRKGNSKQLLLCEACDFQNLKILQRSKLSNQLKDLLETVKKEEEKFNLECEDARKQVVQLEKQALMTVSKQPPPLTSHLSSQQNVSYSGHTYTSAGHAHTSVTSHLLNNYLSQPASTSVSHMSGGAKNPPSDQHASPMPSMFAQRFQQPELLPVTNLIKSSRKRKESPSTTASATSTNQPSSKTFKPGSVLDQTLSKLSQTLIKRKLCEHLSPAPEDLPQGSGEATPTSGEPSNPQQTPEVAESCSNVTTPVGVESRRSRRKGTPKHKRLLSASSTTSD